MEPATSLTQDISTSPQDLPPPGTAWSTRTTASFQSANSISSLNFFAHHVSADGILPLAKRVDAIRTFKQPESQRQLRKFLGMVNFYHRFIPNCAQIISPLHTFQNSARST